jgi:predicted esterase YcpF (UPF0227 family)
MLSDYFVRQGRGDEFICPQLPASPKQAIELCQSLIRQTGTEKLCLIGSSLGGFYATYLAEQFACKALLVNPAVKPPRDLEKYVGVMKSYHSDELFEFTKDDVCQLHAYVVEKISNPSRYYLLAATGDEVLDWREMVAHYAGAEQNIIQGSDHGVSEFEDYIEQVMMFCDAGL